MILSELPCFHTVSLLYDWTLGTISARNEPDTLELV
jgi:hypothetical protein